MVVYESSVKFNWLCIFFFHHKKARFLGSSDADILLQKLCIQLEDKTGIGQYQLP